MLVLTLCVRDKNKDTFEAETYCVIPFVKLIKGFHKHHAAKFIEEKMTERDTLTQAVTLSFTGWTVR